MPYDNAFRDCKSKEISVFTVVSLLTGITEIKLDVLELFELMRKLKTKAGTARLKCTQAVSQIHTLMTQPIHACYQAVVSDIKRSNAAVDVMLNLLVIALTADVQ